MSAQRLHFDSIKADRDWYFVEYCPPNPSFKFSVLQLSVLGEASHEEIAKAMEQELNTWTQRFPVPLMVTAFDHNGDLCDVGDVRESKFLIGYREKESGGLSAHWRLVADAELPPDALDHDYLKSIFKGVPFRTEVELRARAEQRARKIRYGWWIVFAWAVVGPVAFALAEWSSELLGTIVLIYTLWKAFVLAMKLSGKWKKSANELEKEREELAIKHHHYHCVRNPEGFQRLKAENFARWERERLQQEIDALRTDRDACGDRKGG